MTIIFVDVSDIDLRTSWLKKLDLAPKEEKLTANDGDCLFDDSTLLPQSLLFCDSNIGCRLRRHDEDEDT
jgi:hypothetical protein